MKKNVNLIWFRHCFDFVCDFKIFYLKFLFVYLIQQEKRQIFIHIGRFLQKNVTQNGSYNWGLKCHLFLKLIFIGVQLRYNAVFVSTVLQIKSAICLRMSPLFCISCLFRSPQSTEWSFLSYTVDSHQLSILQIVSTVYICGLDTFGGRDKRENVID